MTVAESTNDQTAESGETAKTQERRLKMALSAVKLGLTAAAQVLTEPYKLPTYT